MLEWKPRLVAILLVVIAAAIVAGFADFNLIIDNWEW